MKKGSLPVSFSLISPIYTFKVKNTERESWIDFYYLWDSNPYRQGEDQIPKERKKKGKREEPIRVKRKYTVTLSINKFTLQLVKLKVPFMWVLQKRKEIVNENKDNEVDAAKEIKKTKELKKKIEVRKEVKEEEVVQEESDIEEYNERPVRIYRNGTVSCQITVRSMKIVS